MFEEEITEHVLDRTKLMSVRELAKGTTYTDSLCMGWKPRWPSEECCRDREKPLESKGRLSLVVINDNAMPPPIKRFKDINP